MEASWLRTLMTKSRLLPQALCLVSLFLIPGVQGYAQVTATPVISPASGTYASPLTITITDSTSGSTIYFTTNGTTPTTASAVYSVPFTTSQDKPTGLVVNAIALGPNPDTLSADATATYGAVFIFTLSPTTLNIGSTSNAGDISVTATSENDYAGTVALSCSGLPPGDVCFFNPASLTVATNNPGQTTLTISAGQNARNKSFPLLPGGATLAVALCFFGLRKRRGLQMLVLLGASVIGLSLFTGCSTPGSVATTVAVTVTGTDSNAALTYNQNLSLTQMQSQ